MRNIFELTKREQRAVLVVVMILAASALAKHHWSNSAKSVPANSNSTPAKVPPTTRSDKADPDRTNSR
jgi:hypothetical protein